MDEETKRVVRARANQRCEYCGIHQSFYPDFAFHIEHIVAKQHGGGDHPENLALSCHLCNSKKGPNLSSLDPETGLLTRLFHPRADRWNEHFRDAENGRVLGLTDVGRTTVHLLEMNSEIRTRIRREIRRVGEGYVRFESPALDRESWGTQGRSDREGVGRSHRQRLVPVSQRSA